MPGSAGNAVVGQVVLTQDLLGCNDPGGGAYAKTDRWRKRFAFVLGFVEGNVDFSVWFVRIRDTDYTGNPFAGILKLEKVLVTEDEIENGLETSEIDRITANIINERNPVCYGKDQRWANHLYPVFLTENFIKSKYLSDIHFINLF